MIVGIYWESNQQFEVKLDNEIMKKMPKIFTVHRFCTFIFRLLNTPKIQTNDFQCMAQFWTEHSPSFYVII